jgi:hypothetical protein
MKRLCVFLLLLLLSSTSLFACGDYLIDAIAVMKEGFPALIINPGTKSEINLKVEFAETPKLSPYINRLIEVSATMTKPMDYTQGEIAKLAKIKVLVPDPLAQGQGTKMTLIKKAKCLR